MGHVEFRMWWRVGITMHVSGSLGIFGTFINPFRRLDPPDTNPLSLGSLEFEELLTQIFDPETPRRTPGGRRLGRVIPSGCEMGIDGWDRENMSWLMLGEDGGIRNFLLPVAQEQTHFWDRYHLSQSDDSARGRFLAQWILGCTLW